MSNHLATFLFEKADRDLEACFLADLPGRRAISYRDLVGSSARYAGLLVASGIKPGDRIAVQTEKSVECLYLYLGALRAGAIYLPLNPAYTPSEVSYFVEDADPALLVCSPEKRPFLAPLAEARSALACLGGGGPEDMIETARERAPTFHDVERGADDPAAILYTSGTTGRPKGAVLTHDNLLSNAETLTQYWGMRASDRLLHALPIFHTHGLFVAIHTVMRAGASLAWLTRFDLDEVMASLPSSTVMMGVPTFYTRLLGDPRLDAGRVRHMRLFISGSAPLSREVHGAFERQTGHVILERYGMTETNMNTSNPLDGKRVPGSVGMPLPGVDVRITGADGASLATGEIGSIEVRGRNVFGGYWRRPESRERDFTPDGFFVTGDMGRFDAEGYIHIEGREKDLIISGGLNVYPAEVENAIDTIDAVAESAVVGVPHPDFGEAVVAVVVRKADALLTEAALLTALSASLAGFKRPKRAIFVDALPRNAMGKVQKAELRKRYADILSPTASPRA